MHSSTGTYSGVGDVDVCNSLRMSVLSRTRSLCGWKWNYCNCEGRFDNYYCFSITFWYLSRNQRQSSSISQNYNWKIIWSRCQERWSNYMTLALIHSELSFTSANKIHKKSVFRWDTNNIKIVRTLPNVPSRRLIYLWALELTRLVHHWYKSHMLYRTSSPFPDNIFLM